MSNTKLWAVIASIAASVIGAAAIGAFVWVWQTNIEVRLLRAELTQLRDDKRRDQQQDDHIKSIWRYTGFLHEQVDLLRFKAGLPPANKPNLE